MELTIRPSLVEDTRFLAEWLSEPGILKWFPMQDKKEIDDAIRLWMGYIHYGSALTALWNGTPCGCINLYVQFCRKIAHQALFAIIVSKNFRKRGVGTALIQEMERFAKEKFKLEILQLEVYEGNPAISLYEKLGFTSFGIQTHFIKENGSYLGKIFMQKLL